MNRSVLDTRGALLAVSQFTLYASTRKGNRPSWSRAAPPDIAQPRFDAFVQMLAHGSGSRCQPACSVRTCRSRSSTTGLSPCGWIRGCGNSESPRHRRRNPGSRRHHGRWTAGAISESIRLLREVVGERRRELVRFVVAGESNHQRAIAFATVFAAPSTKRLVSQRVTGPAKRGSLCRSSSNTARKPRRPCANRGGIAAMPAPRAPRTRSASGSETLIGAARARLRRST